MNRRKRRARNRNRLAKLCERVADRYGMVIASYLHDCEAPNYPGVMKVVCTAPQKGNV